MTRVFKIFQVMLFIGIFILTSSAYGQNLALHKLYTVSIKPQQAKPVAKELTDGVYTKKNYNKSEATVRWKREKWVRINIDLRKKSPIGYLTFNTVKGGGDFPDNVFMLLSDDGKHYEYVGDVVNGTKKINTISETIISKPINRYARYVSLIVIPHGQYLFCDEIEIKKGKAKNLPIRKDFTFDPLWKVAKSLQKKAWTKTHLEKLSKQVSTIVPSSFTAENLKKQSINDTISEISVAVKYGAYLNQKFHQAFVLNEHNPWSDVEQLYLPQQNTSGLSYNLAVPLRGVQYGAFILTNTTETMQNFSFDVSEKNGFAKSIKLYEVPFVAINKEKQVVDPFVPVTSTVRVDPGFSKMFIFKISGLKKGKHTYNIKVESGNKKSEIVVNAEIKDILFPHGNNFRLSGNAYPYLQKKAFDNLKIESVVADLQQHHDNVIPVRGSHYPGLKSTDFRSLKDYLGHYSDIGYVLINKYYKLEKGRNEYGGGLFMSSEWKKYFKRWYGQLLLAVHQVLPQAQVLFYPYDEISSEKDIKNYIELIKWAKKDVPGIQFYATLNTKRAIKEIVPLVDIAQIQPNKDIINSKIITHLPEHHAKIWLYTAMGTLRAHSPYRSFRLKAWRAYALNATGVGFWNYADAISSNSITSPPVNPYQDYSVIYTGANGQVISSRRWEAFKLGIEDYEIIYLYGQKYGRQETLKLVQKVLEDPNDVTLADLARNQMMSQL